MILVHLLKAKKRKIFSVIQTIHGFNISVPVRNISTCCCVTEKILATFPLVWRGE